MHVIAPGRRSAAAVRPAALTMRACPPAMCWASFVVLSDTCPPGAVEKDCPPSRECQIEAWVMADCTDKDITPPTSDAWRNPPDGVLMVYSAAAPIGADVHALFRQPGGMRKTSPPVDNGKGRPMLGPPSAEAPIWVWNNAWCDWCGRLLVTVWLCAPNETLPFGVVTAMASASKDLPAHATRAMSSAPRGDTTCATRRFS